MVASSSLVTRWTMFPLPGDTPANALAEAGSTLSVEKVSCASQLAGDSVARYSVHVLTGLSEDL